MCSSDLHGYRTIADIMRALNPFEGAFYLEALHMSRVTREMFCLMEGRHVHPSTLYPGGVGTVPTPQLFTEYLSRLMKYVDFVKRIVGLPGERVDVSRDGFVAINGKRLDESDYIEPRRRGGEGDSLTVPKGRYYLLGDNRQKSCDSRVWGALEEDRIIGEVFAIYWPPQRIGLAAALIGLSLLPLGLRAGRRRPPS